MTTAVLVGQLSDQELLAEVKVAAGRERVATVRLIALLAQVDERRLYLGEGCSSLCTYCTQVLSVFRCADLSLQLVAQGPQLVVMVVIRAPHGRRSRGVKILFALRIGAEERMMLEAFGDEYAA